MSDHSTIILETDIEALYGNSNHKEHINIYYTNIPEYETMDASVTEISNMRNYLNELHWESLMHENDPEQNYQVLLDKLSYGVQKCFRPKKGKTSMNSNTNF